MLRCVPKTCCCRPSSLLLATVWRRAEAAQPPNWIACMSLFWRIYPIIQHQQWRRPWSNSFRNEKHSFQQDTCNFITNTLYNCTPRIEEQLTKRNDRSSRLSLSGKTAQRNIRTFQRLVLCILFLLRTCPKYTLCTAVDLMWNRIPKEIRDEPNFGKASRRIKLLFKKKNWISF